MITASQDLRGRLGIATLTHKAKNHDNAIGYVLNLNVNPKVYVINGGQYVGKDCLVKIDTETPHTLNIKLVHFISSEVPENLRWLSINEYILVGQLPYNHKSFPRIQEIYRYFNPGNFNSFYYLKSHSYNGLGMAIINNNHTYHTHQTFKGFIKYASKRGRGQTKVIITEPDAAQLKKITAAIKQAGLTPIVMEPLGTRRSASSIELTIP